MSDERCPAWEDGKHCFAMKAGGGDLFGTFYHWELPKKCACGTEVKRSVLRQDEAQDAQPNHDEGSRDRPDDK